MNTVFIRTGFCWGFYCSHQVDMKQVTLIFDKVKKKWFRYYTQEYGLYKCRPCPRIDLDRPMVRDMTQIPTAECRKRVARLKIELYPETETEMNWIWYLLVSLVIFLVEYNGFIDGLRNVVITIRSAVHFYRHLWFHLYISQSLMQQRLLSFNAGSADVFIRIKTIHHFLSPSTEYLFSREQRSQPQRMKVRLQRSKAKGR